MIIKFSRMKKIIVYLTGIFSIFALIGFGACENDGIGAEDPCANGHAFSTIPAACTQDSIPGTCTRLDCNAVNPEAVTPALGHEGIVETQTCKSGICTRCGKIENGHYGDWDTYTDGSGIRDCQHDGCTGTVGIGDKGPADGIIFYVDAAGFTVKNTVLDTVGFEAYYLEAAAENQAVNTVWSPSGVGHLATKTGIGTGKENTAAILAVFSNTEDEYAAKAAKVSINGKDDWFLPSRDELNQLYLHRKYFNITSGYFWSSSQYDSNHAYYQYFRDGSRSYATMQGEYIVRAVRAF